MGSENLDSADNQQERLSSEEARSWFIAGFVEGEGSVTVSIKRHGGKPFGLYIQPEFFVYQHRVRRELLEMAQEYFGAGLIRPKPGNPDVLVYSIMSRPVIRERVLPFLSDCGRFSAPVGDYEKFPAGGPVLGGGLREVRRGGPAVGCRSAARAVGHAPHRRDRIFDEREREATTRPAR